jgi:anti-anti-sigma factor
MPAPLALIEDAPHADTRIVSVRGEIDVGTAPSLRGWLDRASDHGRRSVAIDLSRVSFLAVSGVSLLCEETARLARHHAQLTIVCDRPRTLRIFDVCRLGDTLRIVPDRGAIEPPGSWSRDDAERAERLEAWLERYSAGASA